MEETEADIERNLNRITMDASFQSPMQKKDISIINDSGYYESENQVDKISDSKEHVDATSRSSTYSVEQVDPKSDTNSDPSSDPTVATHITNGYSKIINQPNPSLLQASHHRTGYCHEFPIDITRGSLAREFETSPDNYLEEDLHRHGAQQRAG